MNKKTHQWKRIAPLILIMLAIIAFFSLGLHQYLSFNTLQEQHSMLVGMVDKHYFLFVLCYMLIYVLIVSIAVPGPTLLTITGGYLFGPLYGMFYVVFSATLGATVIFLVAKTAIGDLLIQKAGPWAKHMQDGFQKNAINYMLVLRLVPLFPFTIVNIVPAIMNVRLSIYFFTTLFGIMPGTLVYVLLGNGLEAVFSSGETPYLGIIFTPEIFLPLLGLGLLSLIPIAYKKFK